MMNALEWFSNLFEDNHVLGLNKRISSKFVEDKEKHIEDFHDAIANDLMSVEDFYKEIDDYCYNVLEIEKGSFFTDITYGKGNIHRGFGIERIVRGDEQKNMMWLTFRSYDNDFQKTEGKFRMGIVLEAQVGYVNPRYWPLSRRWKHFDVFFDELSIDEEGPGKLSEKVYYFKTTRRALEQVKRFIKFFVENNEEIWKESIGQFMYSENVMKSFLNLKPLGMKTLIGGALYKVWQSN